MIGSHNSMSYLPVRQWYLKPFSWMARCQSKTLSEQFYTYGVRLFDIRIRFDKDGEIVYAHGPIEFSGKTMVFYLYDLDTWANDSNETVYCRIILESNGPMKDQARQEALFVNECKCLQDFYSHITFFGGNRKYDWKEIYHFNTNIDLVDKYSSTTNIFGGSKDSWIAKLDDLWPWLYAKLNNKKNKAKYANDNLLIDFVNI